MRDFITGAILMVVTVSSGIGFLVGSIHAAANPQNECASNNIASYHPAYIIACKLFEERF